MRNLLDFLKMYHHWLLFIFLEVVSGVLLFKYNSYQGSVWLSSANVMTGKIYEWESDVTAHFRLGEENEALMLRNMYLERQVDQLRRLYNDLTNDTTVMERNELAFLSQYKVIPAKVVDNSLNKSDNLMTIDKGRADGVEVDMGLACGNGVVGVFYMTFLSLMSPRRASVVLSAIVAISAISTGMGATLLWLMSRMCRAMHGLSWASG